MDTETLASIPTKVLADTLRERRIKATEKLGAYGSNKRPVTCPYCETGPYGVRELARHKRICANNPNKDKGPSDRKKELVKEARRMAKR